MAMSYTRVVYIPDVDLKLVISTKSGTRDFHDKLRVIGMGSLLPRN